MNQNHIDTILTFSIPYGPRRNVCYCAKEAIKNAIANLKPIPILNNNSEVIGSTYNLESVEWDCENQLCRITVNGVLYDAGATVYPYEIVDGKITSMEFASISLNEVKENNNETK